MDLPPHSLYLPPAGRTYFPSVPAKQQRRESAQVQVTGKYTGIDHVNNPHCLLILLSAWRFTTFYLYTYIVYRNLQYYSTSYTYLSDNLLVIICNG